MEGELLELTKKKKKNIPQLRSAISHPHLHHNTVFTFYQPINESQSHDYSKKEQKLC